MKIKIKTCSCKQCKGTKAKHRRCDRIVTKGINRAIRRQNKSVCANAHLHDSEQIGRYEVDGGKFQGFYFA